jgi:chromosome segregation ATPase
MASRAQLDPFAKIKGLIEDMVTKLVNEANAEAEHKTFCDEEIGKSTKSREEKMMSMDEFQSRMDKASASIETLTEEVKTLQAEVADIDAAQRESAKVRKEEKENYLEASSNFKASAEAVAQAIEVLKNYYEGASLVQVKANKATVTAAKQPSFGAAQSDSGGSIISVLEVSEADFTKMLAEAETAENQAVGAFRKLAEEDELAKVAKLSAVKGRQSEVKSLEVSLGHYKDDHAGASKELDAVMDYLDKLKPECETTVMSYEERKARREAEIEGLKEAMSIIDGESVALVQEAAFLRPVRRA